MTKPLQPCGTDGAYQRHILADETPCQACEDAHKAYHRAYQATIKPGRRVAATRALNQLRQRHPDEYAALLAEEQHRKPDRPRRTGTS